MLTLVAVGTWAATTARSASQTAPAATSINPPAVMTAAKDLPTPQYAEPF
jgi:hypothetical protein